MVDPAAPLRRVERWASRRIYARCGVDRKCAAGSLQPVVEPAELELRRRVAVNVRRLRVRAGLTFLEAGRKGRLSWRHWQKVERREVNLTLKTLGRLGTALEVDPMVLVAPPANALEP